ncbi:MAG: hypothetical protein RSC68_24865, partial [Acinetobacter sp.]
RHNPPHKIYAAIPDQEAAIQEKHPPRIEAVSLQEIYNEKRPFTQFKWNKQSFLLRKTGYIDWHNNDRIRCDLNGISPVNADASTKRWAKSNPKNGCTSLRCCAEAEIKSKKF